MSKQSFYLVHSQARQNALQAVRDASDGMVVEIKPRTRTLDQSAKMWAMLWDLSKQVVWHGRKLDAESWKIVCSSSLKKMDVVPNIEGTGFVALGLSTSKMTIKEMADMIELIYAFGTQHGVKWSETLENK